MHDLESEYEYEEASHISKSQLKREALAARELGVELVKLSREQLLRLNLSAPLQEALLAALSIHAHGARKRQIKYIGGLLSREDQAVIQEGLARLQSKSLHDTRVLHNIEHWRDRLLTEGDVALKSLLQLHPHANAQELRQLIRNAQREQAAAKPPKSARLLFKALRALLLPD